MKTKILFVIDGLEFGGGERVFSQLINGLPEDRYELFLIAHPNEKFIQSIRNPRMQFIPCEFSSRFNPLLVSGIVRVVRRHGIHIINGQGGRAEFHARLAAALARPAKYVSTIAMPVEGYDVGPLQKKAYIAADRLTERFVDRFIVVSDVLADRLIKAHEIPADKVIKIYNGIETELYNPEQADFEFRQVRREFGLDPGAPVIGAIGRLVWQKGFEYLVACIPEVVREFPSARFLLAGDGPLRGDLEKLSRRLKVEGKIIFAGFQPRVREILSALDVVAIPSVLEGFPMVTLEAMAMAKPIVATRIDGITEQIVDRESGLLVPPGNPDALAKAVLFLLRDQQYALRLGRNARIRVKKEFPVEKMISETEKVYKSLLNK
ncbi:MAG: glycosyltransferase family 4 protein [Syntrophales bacterium]